LHLVGSVCEILIRINIIMSLRR